jgi:SAM-dependent methyltransferase
MTNPADRIDPRDVMRRSSVEELADTADAYYRVVSDPTPLMAKPFAFLHETPEMLQNLGLLFAGLSLGRTMTVLDFGAGTCWLSRILTQLNCQAIACDTSTTALEIGRRLFAEHPLIGMVVFQPRFLPFDGRHLDLPDHSVDRIVCFDAFHHVPNPDEVLREFGRVLRPGGIAGFSEPGRRHAETPQSQYEMRNYRVLENNIDVHEIFALAGSAGFTDLTLAVVADMTMSLADHEVLLGRGDNTDLKNRLWNHTHNAMHNRAIFFLHKGPLARDSRSHVGLAHEMSLEGPPDRRIDAGDPLTLTFRLRNTGEARWLHEHGEIYGTVRLGSHLYDGDGHLLAIDHTRHGLPASVAPGEEIAVTISLDLAPGTFELTFDLVAEGVSWFENLGSGPVRVRATVAARPPDR